MKYVVGTKGRPPFKRIGKHQHACLFEDKKIRRYGGPYGDVLSPLLDTVNAYPLTLILSQRNVSHPNLLILSRCRISCPDTLCIPRRHGFHPVHGLEGIVRGSTYPPEAEPHFPSGVEIRTRVSIRFKIRVKGEARVRNSGESWG